MKDCQSICFNGDAAVQLRGPALYSVKSLDVLFGWQLYLVGYLVGRLLRNRVFIEVVMKKT